MCVEVAKMGISEWELSPGIEDLTDWTKFWRNEQAGRKHEG